MVDMREYKPGWSKIGGVAVGALETFGGFLLLTFTTLTVAGLGNEQFPSFAMSVTIESPKICFMGCSDSF